MAPVTRRKQAEMEANSSAAEEPSPAPKGSATERGQKLALRARDDENESSPAEAAKKNTVITFDDEEMSKPVVIEKTITKPIEPVEEEEGESEDEAPETVSTAKVASEMKSAAKATQKATQEQAAAQKRKRQERDAQLKKQAGERKKLDDARSSPAAAESEAADESKSLATARPSAGRRRSDVPALLPAEYLTDSSGESDDDDGEGATRRSKPKRRKVATVERLLTRLDKGPQDATVGSTVYQVSRTTDARLPPKANKQGRNTKALLLKRNRAPVKARRGGFLIKR
ncbi:hypothetical protein CCM_02393 [Cordyceps militaris CM01]|uniref:U3 snoRNA associated n=1 Tax=Cordyceps militaris (strain CM01) TaxID=983644 RepID=G3J9J6_CORMM|nr:uncharacterized protein CCM_02393 [Cordyceps militaris CM01]EGX94122.1 hypothetical protein CCM_02393 [Cordyceps militaris CM01]